MQDETSGAGDARTQGTKYWPDEKVDAICAAVVFTCLTLAALWYVMTG